MVEDSARIVGLHLAQYEQGLAGHMDIHQRLLVACAKAPNTGQVKVRSAAVDCLEDGVIQTFGSVAASARSHANADTRDWRQQLIQAGLADRIEYADVFNPWHHSLSRSSARTSRCRVRSLTCPQMR